MRISKKKDDWEKEKNLCLLFFSCGVKHIISKRKGTQKMSMQLKDNFLWGCVTTKRYYMPTTRNPLRRWLHLPCWHCLAVSSLCHVIDQLQSPSSIRKLTPQNMSNKSKDSIMLAYHGNFMTTNAVLHCIALHVEIFWYLCVVRWLGCLCRKLSTPCLVIDLAWRTIFRTSYYVAWINF